MVVKAELSLSSMIAVVLYTGGDLLQAMLLDFIKDKSTCTGCTACVNACLVGCISMVEDEEGFLYPHADELCIHCDICKRICPLFNNNTERKPDTEQYAAAAVTRNDIMWKRSTSGGAFTEICNAIGDHETIVFGATFNGLKVEHTYVIGVENIGVFRKSKYVQSELGDCYKQVESFLLEGKKVIFSGTPCQVAGLRSYLRKEYDNLFCIDLICHGVGSPKVFDESLEYIGQKYKTRVAKYEFRHKRVFLGNFHEYLSRYEFDNKTTASENMDVYTRFFLLQLCLRPSCQSNCRFRTCNRMGDITLGDFKGKSLVFPRLVEYRNLSTIVVNSQKGDLAFKQLHKSMDIFKCSIDDVKKHNPLFYRTTRDNPERDLFFSDFINGVDIEHLLNKYGRINKLSPVIRAWVPYSLKWWIRRLLN